MSFALTVVVNYTTLAWGGDQLSLFICWLRACLPSQRPLLRLSVFGWRVALVSVSPFQPSWEHLLSWVLYIHIRIFFFQCHCNRVLLYIVWCVFSKAIELVGPSWRTHVALLANVVYSFTLCLLGVVVWLVRDWRQMALATSLPFLAFFFYWW